MPDAGESQGRRAGAFGAAPAATRLILPNLPEATNGMGVLVKLALGKCRCTEDQRALGKGTEWPP